MSGATKLAVTSVAKMAAALALPTCETHCIASVTSPAVGESPRTVKTHVEPASMMTLSGAIEKTGPAPRPAERSLDGSLVFSSFSSLARAVAFSCAVTLVQDSVCDLRPWFSSVNSSEQSRFEKCSPKDSALMSHDGMMVAPTPTATSPTSCSAELETCTASSGV